jgi:hypothetical protein
LEQSSKQNSKTPMAELENLASIIKQTMFEDYRLAYSEECDAYKEEQNRLSLLDSYIRKSICFCCVGFI